MTFAKLHCYSLPETQMCSSVPKPVDFSFIALFEELIVYDEKRVCFYVRGPLGEFSD